MDSAYRQRIEGQLGDLRARGDFHAAATLAIREYGPELLGFLCAVTRDEGEAGEAFSELSEVLWRKLPDFAGQSSVRTWAYGIARNVARTLRRNRGRRERWTVAASPSAIEQVAAEVRTRSLLFLQTEKKTRLQALRENLSMEDQMLLILRVDRQLAWPDLARVLARDQFAVGSEATEAAQAFGCESLEGPALAREAARLRKRFQIIRDRLRALARAEGLVD